MQDSIHDIRHQRERLGLSQAKLAELAQVPQHLLSAFELGKVDLTPEMLANIVETLGDTISVKEIAQRRKRYQSHRYERIHHERDRVARAAQTPGSEEYLRVLCELSTLHNSKPKDRLRAISVFSGCGGFSLGFSAGGFEVVGFLEIDPGLRRIYQSNFQSLMIGTDITAVSDTNLEESFARMQPVDVIIGGPPCQGFSLSGKRKVDDPRNALFRHYLRVVDCFRPKVAVLENVRLLTSMRTKIGGFVKDEICEEFQRHGYRVRHFEVNAKCYGLPQHRERVIFIAVRCDLNTDPSMPAATHGIQPNLFSSGVPYRTFGDACSNLPYLESGDESDDPFHRAVKHPAHVIRWLWDVKEGSSAHENEDDRLRPPSGYNTTYKRQVWTEPASTVQTTFGMISGCRNVHPIATRSLTIREAARLQSFPDDFRFTGKTGTIRTGIGNAVPPLLARDIAFHIREHLL